MVVFMGIEQGTAEKGNIYILPQLFLLSMILRIKLHWAAQFDCQRCIEIW